MQGTIIQYDATAQNGYIADDAGNRFKFDFVDWKELKVKPKKGRVVFFEVGDDERQAVDILPKPLKGSAALAWGCFIAGFCSWLLWLMTSEMDGSGTIIKVSLLSAVPMAIGGYGLWQQQQKFRGWMIAGMVLSAGGVLRIFDLL